MSGDKTPAQVLREARELISDPARWTRQAYARNSSGKPVFSGSKNAVCWCARGALNKAAATSEVTSAVRILESVIDRYWIFELNDDPKNTHADILTAFDRAIAKAEAAP